MTNTKTTPPAALNQHRPNSCTAVTRGYKTAMTSFLCVRSATSAGVYPLKSFAIESPIGNSTRCMNGFANSSSAVCASAVMICSMRFSTVNCDEVREYPIPPRTTAKNAAIMVNVIRSNLHGDDLVNHVRADELPGHGTRQHTYTHGDIIMGEMGHNRGPKHRPEIVRCPHEQQDEDHQRHQADDEPREFALRRQHAYVALDAQSLADGFRDFFHDLGEIAANVFLDKIGPNHNVQILAVHSLSEIQHRVFERGAKVHFSQHAVQFLGNRVSHFLGDQLQSLDKTVA